MKKILIGAATIAACVALCATVWSQTGTGEEVHQEINVGATDATVAELVELPEEPEIITMVESMETLAEKEDAVAAAENTDAPATDLPAAPAQPAPSTIADPYHTDIYPNNVYSEELIYDADGNLIGKTTTYPTAFGSDTIWIDGRAYYDVPGFGLIEWGGSNQRTEDYTMYENGNKVGTMGGEDEPPAQRPSATQPEEQLEATGEVIDQTVNMPPERSSTPPDYKPDTMPPDDPNTRNTPDSEPCGGM